MSEAERPPRRFTELTDAQRKFIARLDAEDLDTLDRVIKLFKMLNGWCRVNRWLAYSLIGALILVVTFLDGLFKFIGSFGKAH